MNKQQLQITPAMIKNAKEVRCDECGSLTFTEKLTFKTISALLSPSGKEEIIPMPIVACDQCGKVSKIFDPHSVIPKELLALKDVLTPESMEVVKD